MQMWWKETQFDRVQGPSLLPDGPARNGLTADTLRYEYHVENLLGMVSQVAAKSC